MKVLCAFALAGMATLGSSAILYSTSFESSDGFTVGNTLDAHPAWEADPGYFVGNAHALSGTQSARWTGNFGTWAYVSEDLDYSAAQPLLTSVYIYFDSATDHPDRVAGLMIWGNDAGGNYENGAGVTISSDGTIRAGDDYLEIVEDTAIQGTLDNPLDRWLYVYVLYTPGATTARVGVEGLNFDINVADPRAEIEDVDLVSDFNQTNDSGTVHFDNYKIETVPEPATLAALGLGAAAMLRRRTRR